MNTISGNGMIFQVLQTYRGPLEAAVSGRKGRVDVTATSSFRYSGFTEMANKWLRHIKSTEVSKLL
jgi:hypothetical protein